MSRTALITGANAGIGRAAALQLAQAGHRVLLGCRDPGRGEEAAAAIREAVPGAEVAVVGVDLASRASIRAAAAGLDGLDVLVHNAAFFDVRVHERRETVDGVETTWATNVLGPMLLTELVAPLLLASDDARVVAVTSKGLMMYPRLAVDFGDVEYRHRRFSVPDAYYQSKLAHLGWMLTLAERWRDTRVRVHGVRVTNVKIDLARYPGIAWHLRAMYGLKSMFSITPDEMARTYSWLATSPDAAAATGGYWDAPGKPAPVSKWAGVAENRERLDAFLRGQLGLA